MTTANLATDWEIHGKKSGTNETPGQAFTMECGVGRLVPLDKTMTKLLELGVIGYDQWQVTADGGTIADGLSANLIPSTRSMQLGSRPTFFFLRRTPVSSSNVNPSISPIPIRKDAP